MSTQVVHVIDDDADVLQALAFLLRTAGFVVEVHASAIAFLQAAPPLADSCLLVDVRMPGMDGLELLRHMIAASPDTPIIVMTAHADVALAVNAMKGGAVDFIEKPFDYDLLLEAVTSALARRQGEGGREDRGAEIRGRLLTLTDRERQVLDGLVVGKPNKVIAHDLGLSVRTVEGYRATVMAKMQAHTLSALIRMMLADLK